MAKSLRCTECGAIVKESEWEEGMDKKICYWCNFISKMFEWLLTGEDLSKCSAKSKSHWRKKMK